MNNKFKGKPTFKCFIEDGGDCKKVTRRIIFGNSFMSSLKSNVFFFQFCDVDKWQSSAKSDLVQFGNKKYQFSKNVTSFYIFGYLI
jgi:hypothetical protein